MSRLKTILNKCKFHKCMRKFSIGSSEPAECIYNSFVIFDSLSAGEGKPPTVLFAYSPEKKLEDFYLEKYTGLIIGFIQICCRFHTEDPCSYIRTKNTEIVLLELTDNIWMAISKKFKTTSARTLLSSMLESCRDIYYLFFPTPKRDPNTNFIDKDSARTLQSTFTMLIPSISWNDLDFSYIFDSFFQMNVTDNFARSIILQAKPIMTNESVISHICILYGRYSIFSTLSTRTTRNLMLCFKMKLPYLFPTVLEKSEDKMYWIIGMRRSPSGFISVYAPPIIIDGARHSIVALRWRKLKIILALKPGVTATPEVLSRLPHMVNPIRRLFEGSRLETARGRFKVPYMVVRHIPQKRQFFVSNDKLTDVLIPFVEEVVIQADMFARAFSPRSAVFIPHSNGFFSYASTLRGTEEIVVCRPEVKDLSELLALSEALHQHGCCREFSLHVP